MGAMLGGPRTKSSLPCPRTAVDVGVGKQWVESVVINDEEELARAYRWARRLALLICRDPAQAEDLVQDAFLSALSRKNAVAIDTLRPWLRKVMVRRYVRVRSRRLRERKLALDQARYDASRTSQEPSESLIAALSSLGVRQRACLVLRYFEDLPESQIASILRIREGTVKAHLAQGRSRLRSALAEATTRKPSP